MGLPVTSIINIGSTGARGSKPVADLCHGIPSAMSSDASCADLFPTLLSAWASVDIVTNRWLSERGGTLGH